MKRQRKQASATFLAIAMAGAVCIVPLTAVHAAGVNVGADTGVNVNTRTSSAPMRDTDVNNDGRINAQDSSRARFDVNGDGIIDSRDSVNSSSRINGNVDSVVRDNASDIGGTVRADSSSRINTHTPRSDRTTNLRSDIRGNTNNAIEVGR